MHDVQQGAGLVHIEDAQRHLVVAAQADCRQVHHAQLAIQHFIVGQMIELLGMRVLEWICSVYTIDLGCLQNHVGIDLDGAQASGGVGGEERVAGTGGEDHDFLGVQVAHGLATIVVIGHANHGDGRHDDGGDVRPLQRVAHGQGIHHGRQHAHVVTGDAIHAGCTERRATEQVATTNHQADLNANTDQLADFQRHAIQDLGVDPELFRAHQGLAAKFE